MAIVFTSEPVAKNTTTKNLDLVKAAECKLQEKSVEYTQNAEFEVLPDEGYDGMSKVNVSVDVVVPTVQNNKDASITSNGTIEILPDSNYDVMEKVTATVNIPLQDKHISIDKNVSMTEITPDEGYSGLSRVEVDVEIPVEDNKQVTITENGTTTIIPGDGYDYIEMCDVIVNVPTYNTILPYLNVLEVDTVDKSNVTKVIVIDKDDEVKVMDGSQLGSNNYQDLQFKPEINGVELNGNITSKELGVTSIEDVDNQITEKLIDYPTKEEVTAEITEATSGKQDILIQGNGIVIDNNTISADYSTINNKPSLNGVELIKPTEIIPSILFPSSSCFVLITDISEVLVAT
jgi:hypothetical protein